MTKAVVLIVALLWAAAMVMAIKLAFFPSAKDTYFAMDRRSLQRAPAGLAVIRSTHFSLSVLHRGVITLPAGKNRRGASRIMGRDVSLREIVGVAWQEDAARVVMPFGAPTNNFDFIITVAEPRKELQKIIRQQFGFTADRETVNTEVLALKIENPALPGLAASGPGEKESVNVKNGALHITHMQIKEMAGGFEQILKTPVVDETSLTNRYDCSLAWSSQLFVRLSQEATARSAVDGILRNWGLGLEPDTASLEMLVVKKVY